MLVVAAVALFVVLAAIMVGIASLISRRSRPSPSVAPRGLSALRDFLQYAFLLAALFTAATGLSRLLTTALPADTTIAGRPSVELALGLSLTLVAGPAWALLWRLVIRRLSAEPGERAAPAWALYLVLAVTVSLIVAFAHLLEIGHWAVGVGEYRAGAIAFAAVWTVVWATHTWLLRHPRHRPTSALPELAMLAGSGLGLVALAVGTSGILRYGLGELYRLVAGPALVEAVPTVALRESLVVALLAVPVWWWHWLRRAVAARPSTVWHAYVMLVPVLGGLLTAVTSLGVLLHAALQWLFGVPEAATAAAHFEAVPAALAAGLVGAWAWWYHRAVLTQASGQDRTEPERVYEYLVAGVGLVAAGAGVTVAIMAAVQALTPGALAAVDPGGRNTLVLATTMLLVGAPLWWSFWHPIQARVITADGVERRAPSRRAYLFLLFGLTGLTAVVSMAVILFVLFRDLLEGTLAIAVLHDVRAATGLVLTAGGVSAYHWAVHREDRAASTPEERPRRSVLLVSPDGGELAAHLAAGTGAAVRRLHRLDAPAAPVDADELTAAVLASPHDRLLITVEEDGEVRLIPYDLD